MAQPPRLTVLVSPEARGELRAIFDYNAEHRGLAQAEAYDDFLQERIESLNSDRQVSRPIEGHPSLWSVLCKRRPRGDGPVLICEADEARGTLSVLRIYHTKMDLSARLKDDLGATGSPDDGPGPSETTPSAG